MTGWGRLYAGDPIDELDAVGLEVARAASAIRTVCDLRGAAGSTGRPSWLDPDVRWELPGVGEDDAGQVAEVATLAADRANHPLLFHAGVGEDRAVVVAAPAAERGRRRRRRPAVLPDPARGAGRPARAARLGRRLPHRRRRPRPAPSLDALGDALLDLSPRPRLRSLATASAN